MTIVDNNCQVFHTGPVHLVGVGGVGMSAVAKILRLCGVTVSGSDLKTTCITKYLEEIGVSITIGHRTENVSNVAHVIRSTAIKDNNPEIIEAKRLGIRIWNRAEALGFLLSGYRTIAITGTHGKTTTTALTAISFIEGGLNPTVVNGGIIQQLATHAILGNSDIAIIESDESDGSFMVLPSTLGIITNMNDEHLDYYGDSATMLNAYNKFLDNALSRKGCIVCGDHERLRILASEKAQKDNLFTYSIHKTADLEATNITYTERGMQFNLKFSSKLIDVCNLSSAFLGGIMLNLYGQHNIHNALAAIAASLLFNVPLNAIRRAFADFRGVKRRFTEVGEVNNVLIIDDYAHHPVEIIATLNTAKFISRKRGGKLIAVLQPHRYTRLACFMAEFASACMIADVIVLAKVYSANEEQISEAKLLRLAQLIRDNRHQNLIMLDCKEELPDIVKKNSASGDLVVMLGAGDITEWAYKLYSILGGHEVS